MLFKLTRSLCCFKVILFPFFCNFIFLCLTPGWYSTWTGQLPAPLARLVCWKFHFLILLLNGLQNINYKFNNQSYVRCLSVTYLQTGHFHKPFSQFSLRYDSRSKHWKRKIRTADSSNSFGRKRKASKYIVGISASGTWIWRQSWPLAGRPIRLKVNGHRRLTFFFKRKNCQTDRH